MKKNMIDVSKITLLIIIAVIFSHSSIVNAQSNNGFDANDYQLAIKEKRYKDALKIINKKKESKRTVPEKELLKTLGVVIEVQNHKWPRNSIAMKEDEVDPKIVTQVKKYINAAIKNYLNSQELIAQKILLHVLFVYPDYPKALFFLEKGLQLPKGTYKVKNQVKKLIKRSDNYFYGGNYLKAVEDLKVLKVLEKDNPVIYEKLGSAYYMMNEKQKAVDQWVTALFFNPENKKLENMIESTKKLIVKEAEEVSLLKKEDKKKVVINDPQVMGVFKRQSEAFELMKQLKEKKLTVAIIESDDGKWIVQASRKELQNQNSKKGE